MNSMKSFLFNALMSCSTESSRAMSRAIAVVANVELGTVPRHYVMQVPPSALYIFF